MTTNTRSRKKAKDTGSVDVKINDSLKEKTESLILDKDQQMRQEYLCARIDELRRKNDELETRLREREKAERELLESEARFRILADDAPALIWVNGLDGAVYVNRAYLEYLGVSGQIDIQHYDWSQYVHPDDCEGYLNRYLDCFMRREPFEAVFRFRRHDGVYRWMKSLGRPRFTSRGEFLGYVGSTQDISVQKSMEDELRRARDELEMRVETRTAELRESEKRLKRSQEIAHLGSWELDLANDRLSWSDEVYRIFGLQPQEFGATYEAFLEAVHPDDRAAVDAAYSGSICDGKDTYEIEHRVLRKSTGGVRVVHEKCEHCRDAAGKIIRSLGMVHDITARKHAEELLQEAKNQAELYLDLMGHDISNMHQIMLIQLEMALDMMEEKGKLGIDDIEVIRTPLRTLERSVNLINNVRKLRQVRSRDYRLEPVDLGPVLDDIVKQYSDIPGRDVTINYPPVYGQMVLANPLVKDVLNNLVDNAVKHTNDSVMIDINVCRIEHKGLPFCQISIEDNGSGIADDKKSLIFQRLISGRTKTRGTGLGLYMVKALVESFKGSIRVEDRVEGDHSQGARFVVSLPAVENNPAR